MPTQRDTNPFALSDTNKRYYTYDYYLRRTFGGKCAKIPLDIGCTCPNIDGTRGHGGCIYCSARGSGDFAAVSTLPLAAQFSAGKEMMARKWDVMRSIPYFQAHTNTYAPIGLLREKFTEALGFDGVVAMNVATRADCLTAEVLALLAELAEQTVLTVELGLQSTNDRTADIINRCHTYAEFCEGYRALRAASSKLRVGVHLINGLPGETRADMERTVTDVAALHPDEVKLHLLHVIRGTRLAAMYERGEYVPMTMEDYVATVSRQLTLLPPETVIGRITGDGVAGDLLAPLWSLRKVNVINAVDKYLFEHDLWQGKCYDC